MVTSFDIEEFRNLLGEEIRKWRDTHMDLAMRSEPTLDGRAALDKAWHVHLDSIDTDVVMTITQRMGF